MKMVLSVECLDCQKLVGEIVSLQQSEVNAATTIVVYIPQNSIGNLKNSLYYSTKYIFWFVPERLVTQCCVCAGSAISAEHNPRTVHASSGINCAHYGGL